ncbi:MAG: hypothetical protein JW993_00770 [Sedimentisphaerales bacterium]|nr:hypothetical protein [Sedimentisphaerales bacterium]
MTLLDYPGHFVAIAIALLLAILTVLGFHSAELRTPSRRGYRWLLVLLQWAAMGVLLVIIWNPSRWQSSPVYARNAVLAVFDTSRSMSVAEDKAPSRLDKALEGFTERFHPSEPGGPQYKIYGFDLHAYHCGAPTLLRRWGEQTDLHSVFTLLSDLDVPTNESQEAGALIFTDGRTLDRDPRRYPFVARDDMPVVLVGVGSRKPRMDIAVTSISAPPRVWADAASAATVTVKGTNLSEDPVTVELACDSQVIETRQLDVGTFASGEAQVQFAIPPQPLGTHVLTVEAKPQKAETNVVNNQRSTSFEATQERRLNVLLYTQWANFDVGKIRQALAWDKRVDLDLAFDVIKDPALAKNSGQVSGYVKLPRDREEFFQYDVIILGPCDLSQFTPAQLDGLYRFVADRGGGLLLLPGPAVTSLAAWNDERGNALLPVVLDEREPRLWPPRPDVIDVTFEAEIGRVFDPKTLAGQDFALSPYYNVALVKPASATLAKVQDTPLASAHRLRRGRVCLLNTSKLFALYRENRQGGPLSEVTSGLVGYLGRTPARGAGIELFVERAVDNPKRAVFSAYVLDQEFRPVDQANVLLSVGERVVAMKPLGQGSYRAETEQGYSQSVVATVQAESNGIFLGERTIAATLPPIEDEMSDVRLDEPFLRELAQQAGARYVHIDDLDDSVAEVFVPTQQTGTTETVVSAWPRWPLLLALCALLSVNWFLRRAIGLV